MKQTKKITFTALFAALCCIATYVIKVPLPYGYFNVGDVFVLLSGWMLGGVWGGVAAGVGSALADLLSGYALYAPVTLVIKALMSVVAYYGYALLKKLIKKDGLDVLPRFISALFAELLMSVGYFAFEWILYGLGGATVALVGNFTQGGICLAIGVVMAFVFTKMKFIRQQFPLLIKTKKETE
ncbi:MAG: ECF transporter S component [Clostridia bacterium]|nr:ECF transporter S component [Clostridia bacterium]